MQHVHCATLTCDMRDGRLLYQSQVDLKQANALDCVDRSPPAVPPDKTWQGEELASALLDAARLTSARERVRSRQAEAMLGEEEIYRRANAGETCKTGETGPEIQEWSSSVVWPRFGGLRDMAQLLRPVCRRLFLCLPLLVSLSVGKVRLCGSGCLENTRSDAPRCVDGGGTRVISLERVGLGESMHKRQLEEESCKSRCLAAGKCSPSELLLSEAGYLAAQGSRLLGMLACPE